MEDINYKDGGDLGRAEEEKMDEEPQKRSGIIHNLWKPDPDKELWLLQFEGSEENFSGFGEIPELLQDAFAQGKEVEIEFTTKEVNEKIYRNIVEGSERVIEVEGEKEEKKAPEPKEKKKEEKEPGQGKLGTTPAKSEEEIVRIVNGMGRFTRPQLDALETEYLKDASRLKEKISNEPAASGLNLDIIFEKMQSPFVYYLENLARVKTYQERKKKEKGAKPKSGA